MESPQLSKFLLSAEAAGARTGLGPFANPRACGRLFARRATAASRARRCVPVDQTRSGRFDSVALPEQPDLTIVGPEIPAESGPVDELIRRGMRVFGPTRRAAMLETSKASPRNSCSGTISRLPIMRSAIPPESFRKRWRTFTRPLS